MPFSRDLVKFTVVSACGTLLALENIYVANTIEIIQQSATMRVCNTEIYLLDGEPIPVVDLRDAQKKHASITGSSALITRDGRKLIALIVDELLETLSLPYSSIIEILNLSNGLLSFFDGYFILKDEKVLIVKARDLFRLGMAIKESK